MSSTWWANKLGAPAPQVPQASTPPVAVSQPAAPPPQASRCPGCGSGNYVGTMETRPRCYDCGYPVVQQGSGAATARGGPATPAKQATGSGFNPNVFINK